MQQRRRSANALGGVSSSASGSHQYAIGKRASPRSSTASPQPFREDTDDDNGYIMGSWQPFPQPGYTLASSVTPSEETPPKTGFARVGGGRAHYDSPYSIARSNQGLEFPSTERFSQRPSPTPPPVPRYSAADTPSNRSTVTVNHQVSSGLPPGAMSPARPSGHVRTKSQTAVVEDASILFAARAAAAAGPSTLPTNDEPLQPPQINVDTDDSSSDATQPKRNHWYNFRRSRRMSDGNVDQETAQAASNAIDDTGNSNDTGGSVGRSFVVLRTKPPGNAGAQLPSALQAAEPEGQEGRRSFVVIRSNNNPGSSRPILPANPSKSSRRSSFA